MTNLIPIYKYAKKHKKTNQTVYRWIREGKFDEADYEIKDVTVKRIFIKENASTKIPR